MTVTSALERYHKVGKKRVLKASQIPCHILTQDWLFESTQEKRAVRVTDFLLSTIEANERKATAIARQAAAKPSMYNQSTQYS
jgi:hypothetical protein